MNLNSQTKYLLAAVVLAGLAFGGGVWMDRQQSLQPKNVTPLLPDLACNLRSGPCRLPLPSGGAVELSILPRNLPPMAPLELSVTLDDSAYEAKWVEFAGTEMDMGFNRSGLAAQAPGRFGGSGMIPVCVSDRMLWEARVMLTDGNEWVSAPFRFEVLR